MSPPDRTALFVRLPSDQAAALTRLADATGRPKQHLVSELLGDRLTRDRLTRDSPVPLGRVEVAGSPGLNCDEVLSLEEAAAFLKLPPDAVRRRAEEGDLPGRRFGKEWRFARTAVLAWLASGETRKRRG